MHFSGDPYAVTPLREALVADMYVPRQGQPDDPTTELTDAVLYEFVNSRSIKKLIDAVTQVVALYQKGNNDQAATAAAEIVRVDFARLPQTQQLLTKA
jgi:hypothetical protein